MKRNRKNSQPQLKPLYPIIFISENGTSKISPELIEIDKIGQKAFGLSCLPKSWTLPFVVISYQLLFQYQKATNEKKSQILKDWAVHIIKAIKSIGLNNNDTIIVRSSAISEGLDERGKYHSVEGIFSDIIKALSVCLQRLVSDADLSEQRIPLVVQKYVAPLSAKGHLSNERRCYKDTRDWLGQFEVVKNKINSSFQINLRNWRKKIVIGNLIDNSLLCNLSAHVSRMLVIPASWAYNQKVRIHFEWIWDGKVIYLVQADLENKVKGINPTQIHKFHKLPIFKPKCLKEISLTHSKLYKKIRNVFTYLDLNLPIAKLYILEDKSIIENLSHGNVSLDLESDIQHLVKESLIIRMDVAEVDTEEGQLLPRTEGIRDLSTALEWLKKQSVEIKQRVKGNIVFIFHNFIPAEAAAFALASPGERKVRIEALWGLPEGLYYNAHDKYIVDTKTVKNDELSNKIDQFDIHSKCYFKHFFISPDESGSWTVKTLKPPYDWRGTIKDKELIKKIALESRLIAEKEGKPLSIMWFINASIDDGPKKSFPWYHEYYDPRKTNRALNQRTKTPFDKTLNLRTSNDIEELRKEALKAYSNVRRVRIQLQEEKLLRDKDTLKVIGELCQKIGAVILLEGGVLSHAYYQLMNTNAVVEVMHPFEDTEDKREFNKLVRDKISNNIEQAGELVNKAKFSGEFLLRALREKLIEEAFETLDAVDQNSILEELADVSEIIDGILSLMEVSKKDLHQKQKQKRKKVGGFKEGIVLLETRNPTYSKKFEEENTLFKNNEIYNRDFLYIDERILSKLGYNIEKSTDKRELTIANESILRLNIPLILDKWSETTSEIGNNTTELGARAKITGIRSGSKLQLELSIYSEHIQLNLPFNYVVVKEKKDSSENKKNRKKIIK